MEELLATSYIFGYLCLYLIFLCFYILLASSYIYASSYVFVYFVLVKSQRLSFCLSYLLLNNY